MKFHKCIPPIFSSFRYKLLLAFLIATMVPLISLTFISYHISYNIARDRIIDSAVMTDKQLVSQLNDRLGQVENVADTIQFQMYSLNQPSSNKVDALKKFTTVKNNISLYKSTFDFFHIYVFLQRHDPVIVPRAVVVVEAMAALTITDALFNNMSARMDRIHEFYQR